MTALRIVTLTLCVLVTSSIQSDEVRYDNYHLIEFTPANQVQRLFFVHLQSLSAGHIFLSTSPRAGVPWLVAVPPQHLLDFQSELRGVFLQRTVHTDLQAVIDAERQQTMASTQFDWKAYQKLDAIYSWFDTIEAKYPQQVTGIEVGHSFEQRKMRGIKIAYGTKKKPVVVIEGGINAHEWISTAVSTYLINQLLTSNNKDVLKLTESRDWYIFPSVNPDGYVYTHTKDRMWRKTRSKPKCFLIDCCFGANGNRNWDYLWNTVGGSSLRCSENYAGAVPFSEVEMGAYEQYLRTLKIDTFIAFHANSQLLMYPFGSTEVPVPNRDHLQQIGEAAVQALRKRYGTEYEVGSSNELIHPSSGTSVDYAYAKLHVPVVFTYKLRTTDGRGSKGFEPPADQIEKVGEETLDSLIALLHAAEALGYN